MGIHVHQPLLRWLPIKTHGHLILGVLLFWHQIPCVRYGSQLATRPVLEQVFPFVHCRLRFVAALSQALKPKMRKSKGPRHYLESPWPEIKMGP